MHINEVFRGIPARSDRGYLGWSSCFLIVTDSGRKVLFDTAGYNERASLPHRLSALGFPMSAVDTVVLSHFHFDHAANWDLFPNADIFLHREELVYMGSRRSSEDPAVLKYHGDALAAANNLKTVEGDLDLGDDLIVLEVPGHTPGSIALKAQDDIFCGDALKNRNELWTGRFGGPLWEEEAAVRSVQKLCEAGQKLYPGHDSALEKTAEGWVAVGAGEIEIEVLAEARICLFGHGPGAGQEQYR